MKLIKVILISIIFLPCMVLALPRISKTKPYLLDLKSDTVKHKRKIKRGLTLLEIKRLEKNHKHVYDDCIFTNKYTITQRLKQYPFIKASKILAVSYHLQERQDTIYDNSGKNIMPYIDILKTGLHINNDVLDSTSLIELKVLNHIQINRLTNLIYNTDYRKKTGLNTEIIGECFDPRNALIFYDKNGKIFDYLEICFECLGAHSRSNKITVGTPCTQKYNLLKHFFIKVGLITAP